MKELLKKEKNVFTKEKNINIMIERYKSFDFTTFLYIFVTLKEKRGNFILKKILNVVNKLSQKHNKKRALILEMLNQSIYNGYSIEESEKLINDFMKR